MIVNGTFKIHRKKVDRDIGRMERDGHWLDLGYREEGKVKNECSVSDLNKMDRMRCGHL